ncbi:Mur ligase family protein [Enterococcus hirae]
MWKIQELLADIDGAYLQKYDHLDQIIDNFEYFSGHLNKRTNYNTTAFVCLTPERRSYINRKTVAWRDGNEQIKGRENEFGLIITEIPIDDLAVRTPQFIVKNSWEFLLQISEKIRSNYVQPIVAITGSAGKTSTRMMISHLFQNEKVLENSGNHNVRFAIPLYLSKLVSEPDMLNLEVSVNALNSYDTGSMSNLVQPEIAIVTSIGEAHLSSLKDTIGVARHKAKIFEGLKQDGTAIINTDIGEEELAILMTAAKKRTAEILTYSLYDQTKDVFLIETRQEREYCEILFSFLGQEFSMNLSVASAGMISNAFAALLTVWKIKGDIRSYLPAFTTFKLLSKILDKTNYASLNGTNFTFIDDTHNASLPAMKNAIDYFDEVRTFYQGKSILVLGQIADLGSTAQVIHESLKDSMEHCGADHILGYGEHFKKIFEEEQIQDQRFKWFATLQELSDYLEELLIEDSLILAKGSVTGSDFHDIDRYIRKIANKKQLKAV